MFRNSFNRSLSVAAKSTNNEDNASIGHLRGVDSFASPDNTISDIAGLHHFLNPVDTVSIMEAVASEKRPCLADIDPATFGLPPMTISHFETCVT